MANLQPSDACREVGAQRVLVCHLPASGKTFIYLFLLSLVPSLADSVKCLHEVDALCQFVHRPAHFKGIHLYFAQEKKQINKYMFLSRAANAVEVHCRSPHDLLGFVYFPSLFYYLHFRNEELRPSELVGR